MCYYHFYISNYTSQETFNWATQHGKISKSKLLLHYSNSRGIFIHVCTSACTTAVGFPTSRIRWLLGLCLLPFNQIQCMTTFQIYKMSRDSTTQIFRDTIKLSTINSCFALIQHHHEACTKPDQYTCSLRGSSGMYIGSFKIGYTRTISLYKSKTKSIEECKFRKHYTKTKSWVHIILIT